MKLKQRVPLLKFTLLLIITIMIGGGCSKGENQALLSVADSLMLVRSDSALVLLESIHASDFSNTADRAKYALLLTQARDKNYVIPTSDSLINIAVDYYDATDDVPAQAKAHYYRGRVYHDMDNGSATVREFLTAISLVEKVEDEELLGLVLTNLGVLFFEQGLYSRADSLYERSEQLNIQRKDSLRLTFTLSNRGRNEIGRGKAYYAVAEKHLKQALNIAEMISNKEAEWAAVSALSTLYSYMEEGRLAVEFAKRDIILCDTTLRAGSYLSLGDAYYKLQQYDSATIYLLKSLPADNYYIKYGAYMRLADIAKVKGELDNAVKLRELSVLYKDSMGQSQQVIDVLTSEKNTHLQYYAQRYETFLTQYQWLLVLLFVFLMLLGIFFFYKRKKYTQKLLCVEEEYMKLKKQLEKKFDEIECLHQQLSSSEANVVEVQMLRSQIETLEKERKSLLIPLFKYSETYLKLQRIIAYHKKENAYKERFTGTDWRFIITYLEQLDDFPKCLSTRCPLLSIDELRLCYLLKLDLSVIEISIIIERTRDSVYKKIPVIMNKLGVDESNTPLKVVLETISYF